MRFRLDAEQREFARSLDAMLTAADTPSVIRAWSRGDHGPGRALWSRLAEAGVFALAVPERYEGGLGPRPVELAVAFVELGRHGVPGPVVETVGVAALLASLGEEDFLPGLASGEVMATLAVEGAYVLDAGAADLVLALSSPVPNAGGADFSAPPAFEEQGSGGGAPVAVRRPRGGSRIWDTAGKGRGGEKPSVDPARHLSQLSQPSGDGDLLAQGEAARRAAGEAAAWLTLATAAQSLGVGKTLLTRTVAYVKQRTQFGTPIGAFQAVKHRLADTLLALEFAEPLLYGAAVTLDRTDLAAAKVASAEAAYAAARTALQLHGAVGYTEELDLSLWIRKAQALRTAWGTPAQCREQVVRGALARGPA